MNRWTIVLDNTLQTNIAPQISLDPTHQYSISLLKGEFLYSWYNISAQLGNNIFYISSDGGGSYTAINVPDGCWSSCTLLQFITDVFGDNGVVPPVPNIVIEELSYNGHWEITTTNNHLFDTGTLGPVIGFDPSIIIPINTPTQGTSQVAFNKVTSVNVICNLVDNLNNFHNKYNTSILFSGGLSKVIPFGVYDLVKYQPLPVQMRRSSSISNIKLKLLDQNLQEIKIKSSTSSFWVEIIDEGRIPTASQKVSSM